MLQQSMSTMVDLEAVSAELKKLDRLVQAIDGGILKVDSELGGALAQQLELYDKPLLLLLDRDDIVIGIDVRTGDFERTYKELQNRY